jgi:hypothetical protein
MMDGLICMALNVTITAKIVWYIACVALAPTCDDNLQILNVYMFVGGLGDIAKKVNSVEMQMIY